MGGIDHSTPANANSKSNSQKQGFIVAGDNGKIRVFVKSDTDVRMPYKRVEGEDLTPSSEHEKENKILFTDVMYHKAIPNRQRVPTNFQRMPQDLLYC